MAEVRVGTSGWHYPEWLGGFYPEGTSKAKLFEAYATSFGTTEINASFYRLPSETSVAAWTRKAPPGFLFAWKGWRAVTHHKRLVDCEDEVRDTIARMAPLGEHFGPILWQLTPQLGPDRERLARFLQMLPKDRRHAIEFRQPGWYAPVLLDLLRENGVALVVSDHHHAPTPWDATAGFAYVRLHGPDGPYRGRYDDAALDAAERRVRGWAREGRDVYVYFDNTMTGDAPFDALRLIARLEATGCRVAGLTPGASDRLGA